MTWEDKESPLIPLKLPESGVQTDFLSCVVDYVSSFELLEVTTTSLLKEDNMERKEQHILNKNLPTDSFRRFFQKAKEEKEEVTSKTIQEEETLGN